ncbi:MAG: serine O-acetyltransferase, partial [Solirubrobacteraceae bacterium]
VEGRRPEGPDADWVHLPDPIADAIKGLARRIEVLERLTSAERPEGAEPSETVPGPNPAGG